MSVIVNMLGEVELGVELGWNYMKFHPNSTSFKPLIIRAVTPMRWKGGITNDKKYLFGNMVEKVLTTVKNCIKMADTSSKSINSYVSVSHQERILVNILTEV